MTRKLKAAASQLWKQFRTLRRALVHPGVPWYAKAVCGCAVAYVASPIQLIPNFIPVIGQLDDVLVIGLSLRLLKRCCPASVLQEIQKDASAPAAPESRLPMPVSNDSPAESSPPGTAR
ncbi:MAG: YkvA family protein [Acidobacteriaceae bacterium]